MSIISNIKQRNTTKTYLYKNTDTNTIIIGAGPAGLAMAACLRKKDIACILLEQTDKIAPKWNNHYKRLHLHTAKEFSSLPHYSFPKQFPRYPSRQQVVRYLEDYARHFNVTPRFNHKVISTKRGSSGWQVTVEHLSDKYTFTCKNIVVATGFNHIAHRPSWIGFDDFTGNVLHSSEYKDGNALKNKTVMVVGFGNSGAEIALDLWEYGARPVMSVRSPVNVLPKEIMGIPTLAMGIINQHLPPKIADKITQRTAKSIIGDLSKHGLQKLSHGPMQEIKNNQRVPMLDVGTIDLIKKGEIVVYPDIENFEGNNVIFKDGRRQALDTVILATGYRPAVSKFITDEQCLKNGIPTTSGMRSPIKNLYFIGFHVSPAGMFREIANEAKKIAKLIK